MIFFCTRLLDYRNGGDYIQEAYEILKGQLRRLDKMSKKYKNEPERQLQITEAMVQIASAMTKIADTVLIH